MDEKKHLMFTLPKHAGALQCSGIVNEKSAFQSLSYMDFEIGDFSLISGMFVLRHKHPGALTSDSNFINRRH